MLHFELMTGLLVRVIALRGVPFIEGLDLLKIYMEIRYIQQDTSHSSHLIFEYFLEMYQFIKPRYS